MDELSVSKKYIQYDGSEDHVSVAYSIMDSLCDIPSYIRFLNQENEILYVHEEDDSPCRTLRIGDYIIIDECLSQLTYLCTHRMFNEEVLPFRPPNKHKFWWVAQSKESK